MRTHHASIRRRAAGARGWRRLAGALAILPIAISPAGPAPSPLPRPAVYGHGRGFALLGAVLSKPSAGPDSPFVYQPQPERWSPGLLASSRAAGFDFIRLIASVMPLMSDDPAARGRALDHIESEVDQATAAGLGVSVSLGFWPGQGPDLDQGVIEPSSRAKLFRAETAVAARLAANPSRRLALELISEPPCTPQTGPDSWPAIQLALWQAIRRSAPGLPLVLTGCRARVDTVVRIDASPYRADPNIVWSFHYYDFFAGQEFAGLRAVPFPPRPERAGSLTAMRAMIPLRTAASHPRSVGALRDYLLKDRGVATIRDRIGSIALWARANGISPGHVSLNEWAPILTGRPENGAIRPDTLRWIRAVRQEAERHGFNWAYWSLPSNDLNYDPATRFFRRDALTALGLPAGRSTTTSGLPR